jgi:hypothetical protein
MVTLAGVIMRDVAASRPVAGVVGRLFFASDTGAAYRDNGTTWDTLVVAPGASFVDDEIVSGSGTSWTLANAPTGLQLFQDITGYGLVGLKKVVSLANPEDYTVSGTTITTQTSFSTGALHAWYRH